MKVGILSFSDGRPRVHETLAQGISDHANRIVEILTNEAVDIEIVTGDRIIYTPAIAREEAFRLVSAGVDAVIFNIPVFAFPYLSVIAAQLLQKPILILTPEDGSLPGLGGMLASAGGLRQIGIRPERVWGSIGDPKVKERVLRFLRAASVVNRLRGQVYGWFGGRSIGMGTTTPDFDRWYRIFGVDVEHIGEIEIIRRAQAMPDEVVTEGLEWLENNCREVAYDGDALTRDTLAFQLKCYLATEELVRERCLDFIGVKCHYDLSEHYVTQCVSCALCNDPYDWRGQKDTTVFSCEGDSDGALTMQILKLLTGQPTLLTDLRHYDRNTGLYVFCNCGAHATWFAHNSADPKENLKDIALYPTIPK
ncbi:MAG: L-fucose isomerase, partial [Alcaligenaceae bacterium]|nr:L-fucose isomerase [Alcaligenaceae bacterium]